MRVGNWLFKSINWRILSEVQGGSLVKDTEVSKDREEELLKIYSFLTSIYHPNVITREEAQ